MQTITQAAPSVFKSEQAAAEVHARYQELLRLWPVPNEQLYIATRQGDTFVVASGPQDAPPLMLLHGTMANAAAWMREVATLVQEFRVYTVDIIGDAGLSAPARPPFGTDAHALWLADVLDGLAVPRIALAGTSLGGAIALDFAIRQPDRVESLILICPGGVADKNILVWALPLLLLGPWGAAKVQERIIGTFPPPVTEEARQYAALTGLIFRSMVPRTTLPSFTDTQLAGLPMPVLVLLGGRDVTMDSGAIKQRFEQHVPQAEVVLYPDARHYLGDQARAITQFLRRVLVGEVNG
jgi:pimeloyl-ACP methyl ester carboxylesterase